MDVISYKCACKVNQVLADWAISHSIIYKKCYKYTDYDKIELTDFDVLSSEASLIAMDWEELRRCLAILNPSTKTLTEFEAIDDIDEYACKVADYIHGIKRRISTSYFSNMNNVMEQNTWFVSIAGKSPNFYSELANTYAEYKIYKPLAPKYEWWKEWHDGNLTDEQYVEKYKETVLSKLDAQKVFNDLTNDNRKDIVLLCWEGRGKFCHRHIVADWLSNELGIEVNEL